MNKDIILAITAEERSWLQDAITNVYKNWTRDENKKLAAGVLVRITEAAKQLSIDSDKPNLLYFSQEALEERYKEGKKQMEEAFQELQRRKDRDSYVDEGLMIELLVKRGTIMPNIINMLKNDLRDKYEWKWSEKGAVILKNGEVIWEGV